MRYCKPFSLFGDDDLQVPVDLRERHFPMDYPPETAVVQATGTAVLVSIWSPQDLVQIHFPTTEWRAEKPYKRSVRKYRIDFRRWTDILDVQTNGNDRFVRGTVCPKSPEWIPEIPR